MDCAEYHQHPTLTSSTVFFVSKLLAISTQPLTWVIVLLSASLMAWRKPVLGRALTATALVLILVMGWQPLPQWLIRQLESQYTEVPPDADLKEYVGAIVLGGASEEGYISQAHTQPLLNHAAERMTAPIALLQRNPHLRIVFTGGEGALFAQGPAEAQRAHSFFESVGLPADHLRYESASRTTYENAVLTAQLPGMDVTQRWLLITSAWHMPRSMATFRKAGWNVTAYPVDFRTGNETPWHTYSLADGTRNWQLALHELLGWAGYRLTGKL
jgi:uncharacterized SAM-binding protein YcdF (DUF218 family)